ARSRAGTTFSRQIRLGQVRSSSAQDLVLLLQQPNAALGLAQFLGLRRRGARLDSGFDVGLADPLLQRHGVDTEVGGDLLESHTVFTVLSDADNVVAELLGIGLGHNNILPGRPGRASQIRCHLLVHQPPYLHSAVDGFSRLSYTEPLSDEKGATAAAFLARAKVWFAAHGISHIHRVVTDNGACYRSGDFERIVGSHTKHQKTKPYTPRHNGKVERYQRILAEELLYAREFSSEDARSTAIAVWNIHDNYHRPHSGAGGRPPASRLRTGVTTVQPSYS